MRHPGVLRRQAVLRSPACGFLWVAAPPTLPSRTSALRAARPTHPPNSISPWGAKPPTPPSALTPAAWPARAHPRRFVVRRASDPLTPALSREGRGSRTVLVAAGLPIRVGAWGRSPHRKEIRGRVGGPEPRSALVRDGGVGAQPPTQATRDRPRSALTLTLTRQERGDRRRILVAAGRAIRVGVWGRSHHRKKIRGRVGGPEPRSALVRDGGVGGAATRRRRAIGLGAPSP